MAHSIRSFLSSVPPTSELEAPTEIQRPSDFPSTGTNPSTDESAPNPAIYENLDWSRLHGYEQSPRLRKRFKSWIYDHGWRIRKQTDNHDYWLCKYCHYRHPQPRRPDGHIYRAQATSAAGYHLEIHHGLNQDGPLPVKQAQIAPAIQRAWQSSSAGIAPEFDLSTFKALLLRLFTIEQLPFAKVESDALRTLLIHCQPRLIGYIPSRRSIRRYIGIAYDQSLAAVEAELAGATTRINLSFDLWTSPGRRLSLLGVVAHYLNAQYKPCTTLLALPRMKGAHIGASIAATLTEILDHFKLQNRFGYAITDNASENTACMNHLSEALAIDAGKRRVLCMGHIINLVAHQVLFGEDVEAFEEVLTNVTAEEVELRSWRRKGPIGKLHNLIKYICHSSKRREVFQEVQLSQPEPLRDHEGKPRAMELIRDNLTRWNSWYDAAVRAIQLRPAIDEFIDRERGNYRATVAWHESLRLQDGGPRKPSLLDDSLQADDWEIIKAYVAILKPCKVATMKLQGQVSIASQDGVGVKSAIWQVLPVFEEILAGFEAARERHKPVEQQAPLASPPPSQPAPNPRKRTRRSQPRPRATIASKNDDNPTIIGETRAEAVTLDNQPTQPVAQPPILDCEHHFSTNINLGWQKLDSYYKKTDDNPIFRAAVVLHPRLKWRWFERYWDGKQDWLRDAKAAIEALWSEYKDTTVADRHTAMPATPIDHGVTDEWSTADDDLRSVDQLQAYLSEPFAQVHAAQSPIPYWISKRSVWPQLAQMALDVYSTPAMSDEPERIFSQGGNLLQPRRQRLTGDAVQEILCLRSWQENGIITLDRTLFEDAITTAEQAPIADELQFTMNHGGGQQTDESDLTSDR